ncbi:MAG: metal-dependent hydrolase [candidate division Zixibacteria bacterium]
MPTIFTHAITGLAAGKMLWLKNLPKRFWIISIILPIIPDADVIMFRLGFAYGHFLGHRGFFHSIPFALVLAFIVMILFFREAKLFSKRWNILTIYFFLISASHGMLDALTNGGEGVALLSPFSQIRWFFPFRPILVSPIGINSFFSEWGMRVIINEILWIWLPSLIVLSLAKLLTRRNRK